MWRTKCDNFQNKLLVFLSKDPAYLMTGLKLMMYFWVMKSTKSTVNLQIFLPLRHQQGNINVSTKKDHLP